jgi:uncharacterized protein YbaP (TraB family)
MRRLLRRLVAGLTCVLLAAASAAAAAPACPPPPQPPTPEQLQAARQTDRGLLWHLQRDGRSLWLYGTVHLGRPEWMQHGPRVAAAFAASEVLALEIDPTDPAVQGALQQPDAAAPPLPPALLARLGAQVAAACLPAGALEGMAPAMQAVVLSVLQGRWLGLDPAFAQEVALAQAARRDGRRIVALETVALQQQVLVPADAAAAQAQVEQALQQLESGSGRSTIARMAQAWERSDLAALEDHASWCDCVRNDAERAAMQALNDARNPALADGIEALHRAGKPVFAAVGALHMTGPAALPRLLAARGFTVRQVLPAPGAQSSAAGATTPARGDAR